MKGPITESAESFMLRFFMPRWPVALEKVCPLEEVRSITWEWDDESDEWFAIKAHVQRDLDTVQMSVKVG